jgi:hypothetical protein
MASERFLHSFVFSFFDFSTRFTPLPSKNDVLVRVLHLSRFFISESTRLFAVHGIQARRYYFHPAQLIQLCFDFNISTFFEFAFAQLTGLPLHQLTLEHRTMIGPKVFQAVADVKEALDEHRRIVAAEPPVITMHASDCVNHSRCNEDWYAIWWNGMGRFLLDGRNPLSYDEALKQFELLDFSEMGAGCKHDMLRVVKGGEGFRHANRRAEAVASQLAQALFQFESGV